MNFNNISFITLELLSVIYSLLSSYVAFGLQITSKLSIMKNSFWALLVAACCFFAPACNDKKETRADEKNKITKDQVPAEVQTAFTAKYPNATEVIWENAHEEVDPTIKVKFKENGKDMKAEFKMDGSFIKAKEDNQ
jgi:hypothetical protein